jgi:hypothetical protein
VDARSDGICALRDGLGNAGSVVEAPTLDEARRRASVYRSRLARVLEGLPDDARYASTRLDMAEMLQLDDYMLAANSMMDLLTRLSDVKRPEVSAGVAAAERLDEAIAAACPEPTTNPRPVEPTSFRTVAARP